MLSFHVLQVSFEQIQYALAQEPDEQVFCTTLKKLTFALVGNRLKHLEGREILCVHRPKTVHASTFQGYKILNEQNHYLYSNVTECLFAAISQSIIDCREQLMHLGTG